MWKRSTIAVHNFGKQPVQVSVKAITGNRLKSMLQRGAVAEHKGAWAIALAGYGYHWYTVEAASGK